jgi:uncharacterized protein
MLAMSTALPGPGHAGASEPLRRFLQVARGAGLRVSAAEGIDAARAVDLVGYADRTLLKDTLGLVLAKTVEEKALYDQTFELYFRREAMPRTGTAASETGSPAATPLDPALPGSTEPSQSLAESSLAQLLESGDSARLAAAVEGAAREVGIEQIRLLTQRNLYTRRIMDRMGLGELEQQLTAMRTQDSPQEARANDLARQVQRLWDTVRDQVERSLLLYARGETEQMRERILKATRLANVDPSQHERMRILLRKMARRIATRYAVQRRRHERGQLDVRRTLRRNMGWGGIPFVTAWKQRRVEKARVMVLCDVSGSVAWVAQFLLMFIYALSEVLSDLRSFAYTSSMVEVSEVLESRAIDDAIEEVTGLMGFGSSNYGTALAEFENGWMADVTSKTVVIILGDARGNGTEPRADVMERLARRARRIIWLNPEPRSAWGTGDSDMFRYAPYCQLTRVCNTLNDLERVITDLLEQAR